MSVLEIGLLQPDDIPATVELWRVAGLVRPWNDPMADIRLALDSPSSTLMCGKLGGEVIATAMVGFDGHRAWIYYLAVAGELRGLGHGRAMVRACEAWATARGALKMNLMVRSDNVLTSNFYRAIGFEDADVRILSRWLPGGG